MPEEILQEENPIYKFMKSNNLTDLNEGEFLTKYSAPNKAKEIHSFMVSNKLTDLDESKFYDSYLKKKDQGVLPSVSSPTQSLSPDFEKGKAFAEKGFLMKPEGTKEQKIATEEGDKQGLLLNLVSGLDRGFYKNFIGSPVKGLGTILQGATKKVMGGTGEGFISDNLIKFGDYFNNAIDELTFQDEEFKNTLLDQATQALGQVGSLVITGGLTGAAGKGAALVAQVPKGSAAITAVKTLGSQLASPTAASAGLSMGQAEFDRAIQAGATDDQAFEVFYKNAAVGSVLETIPVMQFFKRFNKSTAGSVANYIKTKGVAGLTGGIEEMTTEVMQQLYANKTAKDIYNINQDILDGVGSSGGVGFGVGFLLNAMGANAKILRKQGKVQEADVLDNQVKQYQDNLENPKVTSGNKVSAKDIVTQGVEIGTQKAVKNLDRDLANGVITPEQHQEGIVFAEKAAQVADKIPETVTGESRVKSVELLVERNDIKQANDNLIQQKQTTDEAYHAGIDEEIKANEERIKKIDSEVYNITKKPSKDFGTKTYTVDGEEVSQEAFEALKGKPLGTKTVIKAEVKPTEVETKITDIQKNLDLANKIEKARSGDKKAQEELAKFGIKYDKNPIYRYVSESEVNALNNGEQIEGKFKNGRVDVTINSKPSTGANAEYRITFNDTYDFNKGDKAKVKNEELGDGWIAEGGYNKGDVLRIEKRNEDGSYTSVYEGKNKTVEEELNKQLSDLQVDKTQKVKPIEENKLKQYNRKGTITPDVINLKYDDNGKEVGGMTLGKYKNYLTLDHIYFSPEYRGTGLSKYAYKDALEIAEKQGYEGLMVGGQLTTEYKTKETYKNFATKELDIKNEKGNPYILLTDWIGKEDIEETPEIRFVSPEKVKTTLYHGTDNLLQGDIRMSREGIKMSPERLSSGSSKKGWGFYTTPNVEKPEVIARELNPNMKDFPATGGNEPAVKYSSFGDISPDKGFIYEIKLDPSVKVAYDNGLVKDFRNIKKQEFEKLRSLGIDAIYSMDEYVILNPSKIIANKIVLKNTGKKLVNVIPMGERGKLEMNKYKAVTPENLNSYLESILGKGYKKGPKLITGDKKGMTIYYNPTTDESAAVQTGVSPYWEKFEEVKPTEDIYFNKLHKSEKFDDDASVRTYLGEVKGEKNIFYTLPNKGIIAFKETKNNTNRFSLTANAKNDTPSDIKNAFKRIEKYLPANHELVEDKSISVDGLRVWDNFIKNGKYKKTGETNEIEITPIDKTNLFKNLKYTTETEWSGAKFENKGGAEALARVEKYIKNNNLDFKVKLDGDVIKVEVPVLKYKPTEVKEVPKKTYQEALKEKQAAEKKQTRQIAGEKAAITKEIYRKVNMMDDPRDAEEAALRYLAGGGKIRDEDINDAYGRVKRAELNTGRRELKSAEVKSKDFAGGKEKISDIAHRIWEDSGQEISEKEAEEALMAEIGNNNTRLEAAEAYLEKYSPEYLEEKTYQRQAEESEAQILEAEQKVAETNKKIKEEFKEVVGKASKKAKENAKKDFVDRNFEYLKQKIKIEEKCPF
jgi:GNAT superfamily N-acetyltransferase